MTWPRRGRSPTGEDAISDGSPSPPDVLRSSTAVRTGRRCDADVARFRWQQSSPTSGSGLSPHRAASQRHWLQRDPSRDGIGRLNSMDVTFSSQPRWVARKEGARLRPPMLHAFRRWLRCRERLMPPSVAPAVSSGLTGRLLLPSALKPGWPVQQRLRSVPADRRASLYHLACRRHNHAEYRSSGYRLLPTFMASPDASAPRACATLSSTTSRNYLVSTTSRS